MPPCLSCLYFSLASCRQVFAIQKLRRQFLIKSKVVCYVATFWPVCCFVSCELNSMLRVSVLWHWRIGMHAILFPHNQLFYCMCSVMFRIGVALELMLAMNRSRIVYYHIDKSGILAIGTGKSLLKPEYLYQDNHGTCTYEVLWRVYRSPLLTTACTRICPC